MKEGWWKYVCAQIVGCHYIPGRHRPLFFVFIASVNDEDGDDVDDDDDGDDGDDDGHDGHDDGDDDGDPPHSWGCDPPFGERTPAGWSAHGVRGDYDGVVNTPLRGRDGEDGDDNDGDDGEGDGDDGVHDGDGEDCPNPITITK